jgi:hypothetical protein
MGVISLMTFETRPCSHIGSDRPGNKLSYPLQRNIRNLELSSAVLACGGPSLSRADPFAPGFPVVAVSTSLRATWFEARDPAAWIAIDPPKQAHGRSDRHGMLTIGPRGIRRPAQVIPWAKTRGPRESLVPFARHQHPIPYGGGSFIYAIQACWLLGCRRLLLAGVDLDPGITTYAYDRKPASTVHLSEGWRILNMLKPHAERVGYEWFCYSPGSRIAEIMPCWTSTDVSSKPTVAQPPSSTPPVT